MTDLYDVDKKQKVGHTEIDRNTLRRGDFLLHRHEGEKHPRLYRVLGFLRAVGSYPTAYVRECFLPLTDNGQVDWKNVDAGLGDIFAREIYPQ